MAYSLNFNTLDLPALALSADLGEPRLEAAKRKIPTETDEHVRVKSIFILILFVGNYLFTVNILKFFQLKNLV